MKIDPDLLPVHFPPMFSPENVEATDHLSLKEAREWLRYRATQGSGTKCPCCGAATQFYAQRINKTMAIALGWLVQKSTDEDESAFRWVNVPKEGPRWLLRSNQLATLRHWGLLERLPKSEGAKTKHSGIWRPTDRGYRWVKGEISIQKFVVIYRSINYGYFGPLQTFAEAAGSEFFDYTEAIAPIAKD